ncbi:MAG TPA: protein-glutamate O-methyltransferase CheR [Polyangiales bacterium]|nr:protein-glutamate O-methyltransferase CheR [Polyangiales bacterium]
MTLDALAFACVRKLVYERAAIVLDDSKHYLVESRLASLAHEHGFANVDELCASLPRAPERLQSAVVEAMTTNETSFFRDHHPFEAIRRVALPELIAQRARKRTLRIWCAACSSGQEPYSVAIMLDEHFPALSTWRVQIYATDLASSVVARAREGRYSQIEVNRGLSAAALVRYFTRDGLEYTLKSEIRKRVQFSELNLIGSWPTLEPFDLVLLRNVLIYFDHPTKLKILQRMRTHLASDGYLMLGGAETLPNEVRWLTRVAVPRGGLLRASRTSESSHAP